MEVVPSEISERVPFSHSYTSRLRVSDPNPPGNAPVLVSSLTSGSGVLKKICDPVLFIATAWPAGAYVPPALSPNDALPMDVPPSGSHEMHVSEPSVVE